MAGGFEGRGIKGSGLSSPDFVHVEHNLVPVGILRGKGEREKGFIGSSVEGRTFESD